MLIQANHTHSTLGAPQQDVDNPGRPQLIFATELDGSRLLALLQRPGLLETLALQGYSVAISLPVLDSDLAEAARLLNQHAIPLVAWLMASPEEGFAFNAQNYPQALTCYRAFHEWAASQQLHFEAIGLEIAPPTDVAQMGQQRARRIIERLYLASSNMLYPVARAAYTELIAAIHQDGYEVHTYQLPFIVDERRAGTTLVQRALDIVDLPSDLDVLMCSSSVPIERLHGDLGGSLVACYGPAADAIGIGGFVQEDSHADRLGGLPWPALRRDLLLAARYTDTIYIDSLEGCIERGLLPQIAALDWSAAAHVPPSRMGLTLALRWATLATLIGARFGPHVLAWAGWVIAALLWLRGRQTLTHALWRLRGVVRRRRRQPEMNDT